jgi:hypothetical protein
VSEFIGKIQRGSRVSPGNLVCAPIKFYSEKSFQHAFRVGAANWGAIKRRMPGWVVDNLSQ